MNAMLIDYPAADMTITVESGMTVADLQATLAENNQHLPIDIPTPELATIGQAVSQNVSGSRRFGYGTFRDYVIGLEAVDGRGRRFKSGGRVVKNVAGYDLCKLLIGSHGTLADIKQLTFKVLPQPRAVGGVRFEIDDWSDIDSVLDRATTSATRPIVIDLVSDGEKQSLVFAFDGGESEVAWQQDKTCEEVAFPAERFGDEEFNRHLLAADELHVPGPNHFVAGLLPSMVCRFLQQAGSSRVVSHAGNGIVVGETKSPHAVRSMAEGLGGWYRRNEPGASPFEGSKRLSTMRKLQRVFDPDGKLTGV